MKRLSADDSADSRVKVGHRQATIPQTPLVYSDQGGLLFWGGGEWILRDPA